MARLCRKSAVVHEAQSRYDAALEWLARGLAALGGEAPSIEPARLYVVRAGVAYRQGKLDASIAGGNQSLDLAHGLDDPESQSVIAQANYLLGNNYYRRGEFQRAAEFCRASVGVYQQLDDIVGQCKVYNNLGNVYAKLDDWDAARDALHRSLRINREIGAIQEQGFVLNNLGLIYLDCGDWDEAALTIAESNAIWRDLGAPFPEAVTLSNLAQVYIRHGDWPEARASLARSQALFAEVGSETFLAELERRWSQYHLHTGALDEAHAHIQTSIELAVAQEARLEEGMSLRTLGEIHRLRGETARAEAVLRRGLSVLTEVDSQFEAAKTQLSLARLLAHDRCTEARDYLLLAVAVFERLGARADRDQARLLLEELAC